MVSANEFTATTNEYTVCQPPFCLAVASCARMKRDVSRERTGNLLEHQEENEPMINDWPFIIAVNFVAHLNKLLKSLSVPKTCKLLGSLTRSI